MRSSLVLVSGVLTALAIQPVGCGGGGDGDGTAGRAPDAASDGSGGTQGIDGAGWPDSPVGDDAALEGASDAPVESGDASDGATSNGCRDGVRRGFTSVADFPSVAACGDAVGYADAVTNAATACDVGWHFCTPIDISQTSGAAPDFVAPVTGAWVHYDSQSQTSYAQCSDAACASSLATSNLAGSDACTASGAYPEGWRLAVSTGSWPGSHDTENGCVVHVLHACGFPGGSVSMQSLSIACCKG